MVSMAMAVRDAPTPACSSVKVKPEINRIQSTLQDNAARARAKVGLEFVNLASQYEAFQRENIDARNPYNTAVPKALDKRGEVR